MPSYSGAVPRDNWEKHGEQPSVKDWGAKGDGTTDDLAAIAAAIAAAKSMGGGNVYFPAGTYKLSAALPDIDNAHDITLYGEGCGSIILAPPVVNGIVFNITNSHHITVRNLYIKGATDYSNFGVRVVDSSDITVVDNVIEGGQCGIRFIGMTDGACLRMRAERNIVRGLAGPDSAIAALGGCRFVWLVGNLVDGSGQEGVTLDYGGGLGIPQDCVVANNIVRNTGRFAVSMYHVRRVSVTGNTMYNTGLETLAPGAGGFGAIDAATDTATSADCNEDIAITGNTIEIAGFDGIRIQSTKRFTVSGNVIRNAGHAGIVVYGTDVEPNIGTVSGNSIWATTPVTGTSPTAAILIENGRNISVCGNSIDGNTVAAVDGIRVLTAAQYVHIADNTVDRNNTGAYSLFVQGANCSAVSNRLYPGALVDLSGTGIVQRGNSYLDGYVIPDSILRLKTSANSIFGDLIRLQNADSGSSAGVSIVAYDDANAAAGAIKIKTGTGASDRGYIALHPGGQGGDNVTSPFRLSASELNLFFSAYRLLSTPDSTSACVVTTDATQALKHKDLTDPTNVLPPAAAHASTHGKTGSDPITELGPTTLDGEFNNGLTVQRTSGLDYKAIYVKSGTDAYATAQTFEDPTAGQAYVGLDNNAGMRLANLAAAAHALCLHHSGNYPVEIGTNNIARWLVAAAGHLLAAADNSYDIGASGASRPRDVYIGRNLTVGGTNNIAVATQSVVTGSRALGAVYQNTTGKPMTVSVSAQISAGSAVTSITPYSDASNPPTTALPLAGASVSSGLVSMYMPISFVVLPGNYYKVVSTVGSGGSVALNTWTEWY